MPVVDLYALDGLFPARLTFHPGVHDAAPGPPLTAGRAIRLDPAVLGRVPAELDAGVSTPAICLILRTRRCTVPLTQLGADVVLPTLSDPASLRHAWFGGG